MDFIVPKRLLQQVLRGKIDVAPLHREMCKAVSASPQYSIDDVAAAVNSALPKQARSQMDVQGVVEGVIAHGLCRQLATVCDTEAFADLETEVWERIEGFGCATRGDVRAALRRYVQSRPLGGETSWAPTMKDCQHIVVQAALDIYLECIADDPLRVSIMDALPERSTSVLEPVKAPSDDGEDLLQFVPFELKCCQSHDFAISASVDREYVQEYHVENIPPYGVCEVPSLGYYVTASLRGPCTQARLNQFGEEFKAAFQVVATLLSRYFTPDEGPVESFGSLLSPPRVLKAGIELYFDPASRDNFKVGLDLMKQSLEAAADPSSRLLRAMAALEALVGGGKKDGITETLARRSSFLLAPEAGVRDLWFERFEKLYNERSKVAHGRLAGTTKDQADSTLLWSVECARALLHYMQLKKALGDDTSHSDLLKGIDKDARTGKSFEASFRARPDLVAMVQPR